MRRPWHLPELTRVRGSVELWQSWRRCGEGRGEQKRKRGGSGAGYGVSSLSTRIQFTRVLSWRGEMDSCSWAVQAILCAREAR